MDTKKLRQKILDLAIRGKLVPQDPNDEPASVLLERIRAEKEQLIKEGKIKRSKKSASTDKSHYENPPFEIPESWEWTSIGDVAESNIGLTYKPGDICTHGVPVFRSNNIQNRKISLKELVRVSTEILTKQYLQEGDLLICARNGSRNLVGKCAIIECLNEPTSFGAFMTVCRSVFNPWIFQVLNTDYFNAYLDDSNSTAINQVTQKMLLAFKLPIPPITEQERIIHQIQQWFKLIDTIEDGKIELESYIKQTKSKIHDLAISGKLVPQNPNDEPAIELLKRINPGFKPCDNSHYENLPFEIPDSWELCKFGDFLDVRDGTHNSPRYLEKGYPLVTSKNLKNGDIDFDTAKFISTEDYINFSQRSFVEDGDILFAMIGSIGNPVLVKKCREFSIKNVALFKPYDKIHTNMKYVFYYLLYVQEKLKYEAKGGMQPFIPLNYFRKELYIPIPPYNEQERIVEKVSKIFEKIDSITAEL